jgi:hypothetical protein
MLNSADNVPSTKSISQLKLETIESRATRWASPLTEENVENNMDSLPAEAVHARFKPLAAGKGAHCRLD